MSMLNLYNMKIFQISWSPLRFQIESDVLFLFTAILFVDVHVFIYVILFIYMYWCTLENNYVKFT
jgi:hypothetical protein